MPVLRFLLVLFVAACPTLDSLAAAEKRGVFTGIRSKEGVGGRPKTARITDGKTFIDITEQEYREQGLHPHLRQIANVDRSAASCANSRAERAG